MLSRFISSFSCPYLSCKSFIRPPPPRHLPEFSPFSSFHCWLNRVLPHLIYCVFPHLPFSLSLSEKDSTSTFGTPASPPWQGEEAITEGDTYVECSSCTWHDLPCPCVNHNYCQQPYKTVIFIILIFFDAKSRSTSENKQLFTGLAHLSSLFVPSIARVLDGDRAGLKVYALHVACPSSFPDTTWSPAVLAASLTQALNRWMAQLVRIPEGAAECHLEALLQNKSQRRKKRCHQEHATVDLGQRMECHSGALRSTGLSNCVAIGAPT